MSHPHDRPADEQLFDLLLEQAAPATASVPVQIPTPAPARDEAALSNFQQRLWLVQIRGQALVLENVHGMRGEGAFRRTVGA